MEATTTNTPALAVMQIHPSMVAIANDIGKIGVSKDRKNTQQNFAFRGIDDVQNALNPIMARHEVYCTPEYEDYPDVERATNSGGTLVFAKVRGTFTFRSGKDGSSVTVVTIGKAMDTADKATNKAMSAAYKYCFLQVFNIPTESNEDADASTPEPSVPKPPDGFEDWLADMVAVADNGDPALRDAWRKSAAPFKEYVKFREPEWKAVKTKAANVTKAQQAAEAAAAAK